MQINFHQVGGERLYIYYPVILIGISVALLFNPFKVFYFRTRMWLLYSLVSFLHHLNATSAYHFQWRLMLAGVYPVEWRDFYMGDMFCSLTYSMSVSLSDFFSVFIADFQRVSLCSFACTPTTGTTHPSAIRLTCALLGSSVRCQVCGGCYNVSAVTKTPATSSLIC